MTSGYRELRVWRVAMDLAAASYRVAVRFPTSEVYGLGQQIRRAAVSVPANIAEGNGRAHRGDYLRLLSLARGSLQELETHLLLASRLGYVTTEEIAPALELCDHVSRIIKNLDRALRR